MAESEDGTSMLTERYIGNEWGRRIDYFVAQRNDPVAWVSQSAEKPGSILDPPGTGAVHLAGDEQRVYLLAYSESVRLANEKQREWRADTGKRWDSEQVVEEEPEVSEPPKIHSEYETTIKGRRMNYVIGDDTVSVIWVVQNIDPDGRLREPSLDTESISSGAGINYTKCFADVLDHAIGVFDHWSADTGKRWDGERAIVVPSRLSDQIKAMQLYANHSHSEAQSLVRAHAAEMAREFEQIISDALFVNSSINPVVRLAAQNYRDGKPLAECIRWMVDGLTNLAAKSHGNTEPAKQEMEPPTGSRLRRHNITDDDAIAEMVTFLNSSHAFVAVVSDSKERIASVLRLILIYADGMKSYPGAPMTIISDNSERVVIGFDISPSGNPRRLLGLSAPNMLIMVDEAGEYSDDTVDVLNSYEQMFSRRRAEAFSADMRRRGLSASAEVAE